MLMQIIDISKVLALEELKLKSIYSCAIIHSIYIYTVYIQ